ncbi:hypothetical protein [Nucisporomicrobium flavum]|uniref:hypothetical protein n=1 Tax=Nucisporomicrobium flavum TaxID=2785915 RepID=UPI0018F63C99|nr:hypothetical protein [Nucisporomicrobium flavum]
MVSVARDVALFRRGRAEETRSALAAELKKVWDHLVPLIRQVSPEERSDIRAAFWTYCDAAAHRRVRRRQMFVIVYAVVSVLAVGLTVSLITWTLDRTRPVVLLAYLITAFLLVSAVWWAVHRRSPIGTAVVAVSAAALAWELRPHSPAAAWWDPRSALASSTTDGRRVSAGIALGSGLTLVLIVVSLLSMAALTPILRSRQGGGSGDVRAFDQFLEVVRLLVDTERRPGINRRSRIQEGLRTAEVALLVMARGGRPVGWAARWHGRKHHREHIRKARRIIAEIQRPNPLAGLREVDDHLLSTMVTCLIGICRDQLGEVLTSLEEAAAVAQPSPAARARRASPGRRKLRQLGAITLPLAILLLLRHFDVPMPGVGWLFGVGVLILALGSFVVLMPGLNPFLDGLGKVLSAISAVLPSVNKEPAGGEPASAPEQRAPSDSTDPAEA